MVKKLFVALVVILLFAIDAQDQVGNVVRIPAQFRILDYDPRDRLFLLEPTKRVVLLMRFIPGDGESKFPELLTKLGRKKYSMVVFQAVVYVTPDGKKLIHETRMIDESNGEVFRMVGLLFEEEK